MKKFGQFVMMMVVMFLTISCSKKGPVQPSPSPSGTLKIEMTGGGIASAFLTAYYNDTSGSSRYFSSDSVDIPSTKSFYIFRDSSGGFSGGFDVRVISAYQPGTWLKITVYGDGKKLYEQTVSNPVDCFDCSPQYYLDQDATFSF